MSWDAGNGACDPIKIQYKALNDIHAVRVEKHGGNDVCGDFMLLFSDEPIKHVPRSGRERIVSAFDVAIDILQHFDKPISTMKLHKLLYYSQAWNLVWEEKPLFKEKIEAWANGPVVRQVFYYHRGLFEITKRDFALGNAGLLSEAQHDTIDSVMEFYGNKSAQWLIDQTHSEMPWKNARRGLASNERGDHEILLEDMMSYYASLK